MSARMMRMYPSNKGWYRQVLFRAKGVPLKGAERSMFGVMSRGWGEKGAGLCAGRGILAYF